MVKFKNKKILFIPVYSMRSYETGVYNLAADGNMARVVSKALDIGPDANKIVILIPENSIGVEKYSDMLNSNTILLECDAYGENAAETRNNPDKLIEWIKENIAPGIVGMYDYVIVEPNLLVEKLDEYYGLGNKLIYWCVASATDRGTPWFCKDYAELDKKLASKYETWCASQGQVNYLKGKSQVATFYNPHYFNYKTIFFPFRLSDPNYNAAKLIHFVDMLVDLGITNFKVLYTDPNDSNVFKDNSMFVKVPSQKEVYTEILKAKPIIPYFEDHYVLNHIGINEFKYYGCKVIMYRPGLGGVSSFSYVNNDYEFFIELVRLLTR